MFLLDVRKTVRDYLTVMMEPELTNFLGEYPSVLRQRELNHRKSFYNRTLTLKDIGAIAVNVPKNRKGEFTNRVIPCTKSYEEAITVT